MRQNGQSDAGQVHTTSGEEYEQPQGLAANDCEGTVRIRVLGRILVQIFSLTPIVYKIVGNYRRSRRDRRLRQAATND
jgi:hypothetical protein